ncbi:hypothetical protein H8356DRAFT_1713933 [Neocallimastix lanati (nom. inval.)]|uniref:Mediator of RNA polymerase II transcription subunit 10 n=1 Tax=Neocallimastix californiae TaxID=1754190 RepID=A0A1Y2EGH8_9FUNG|nr:hypothetical protein H8356DRAFT_1713933 [Neocallimastix sp. JGI-2020a]ORY70679.1 hypothetical protein LY90DRAFT_667325 [Neocallimastix californiae]|eukprot:ORY70679.1 hypothetical protein LY90DRAFT_667325 [Neocallimastix californiae]
MEDEINIDDIDDNFDDNFDLNNEEDKLVGDPLDLLEMKTLELINTLYNLNVIVYDENPNNKALHNRIEEVVHELKELDEIKENVDIKIPQELLDDVEQGKNPDIFTNNLIKATVSQNQSTNGKIEAIKLLSNTLQKNIQNILPQDYEIYQKLTNENKKNNF